MGVRGVALGALRALKELRDLIVIFLEGLKVLISIAIMRCDIYNIGEDVRREMEC